VNLTMPRIALPILVTASRASHPNGVLLLLSALALGMLVVASLALLRRVRQLNGGRWT
jgi:hypothetical protein